MLQWVGHEDVGGGPPLQAGVGDSPVRRQAQEHLPTAHGLWGPQALAQVISTEPSFKRPPTPAPELLLRMLEQMSGMAFMQNPFPTEHGTFVTPESPSWSTEGLSLGRR